MNHEFIPSFNLKCAEFLGWKRHFAHEPDMYGYIQTVDGYFTPYVNHSANEQCLELNHHPNIHSVSELNFHSDWNWIHNVIDKVSFDPLKLPMNGTENSITPWMNARRPIIESLIKNDKSKLIESIDQYIDWYNENK